MTLSKQPSKLLTIGGSDSGGAAGIQADLKTWSALGAYGMTALTAVTAQNSMHVAAVQYLPGRLVAAQIESVLSDYGAAAVKTGFIGKASTVRAIARSLQAHSLEQIIIDPVLVNHRQEPMFAASIVSAYRKHLLPLAKLVTPNGTEAFLLAGLEGAISSEKNLSLAIVRLHETGVAHVLVTGVRQGDQSVDYYSDGNRIQALRSPWIETQNRHGSGDTLSAAICAFLAQGDSLFDAILQARRYTSQALINASDWCMGAGHGPLNHNLP